MDTTFKSFTRLGGLFILVSMAFSFSISAQELSTECPYFNISSSDSTGVSFSLISTDIDATVSGVIANVVIEQTYMNTGDSIVDATYVFPMSTNAAVYGMEMQLNQKVVKAEIKRKAEAQTIFDAANENGLTASLLEQHRPNVFQMSLANIKAGDTLSIRMRYTELLVPEKANYQFVFPTIVGPRFTTGGEPWVLQNAIDSLSTAQSDLNINLKINSSTPLTAECKSHNVTFDYMDNSVHTFLSTKPEKDFIVDFRLDGNEIETGILLYEEEEENFFLSMIQPAKPEAGYRLPPREYVFIMDVSGSMTGTPLEISKDLISRLLQDLNPTDKFNIIFFAGGNSVFAPSSLNASTENIDAAIAFLDNINSGGGTHILTAMQRALDMIGTDGYSRTFVILTDGYVTVEKEAYDLIRNNLNEANFFSFGIGTSVNRFIIEGIAYVGEGEAFIATNFQDAQEVANNFREYISLPVLTNLEAEFDGIDVYDVEPLTIPDVFAERPIIIYGKYVKPAQGSVTLKGDYGNGMIEHELNFEDYSTNKEDNIALKYLWARKRIKLMSDYGISSNETDNIIIEEEITLMGLKYNLVTNFTSFVAVDSCAVTPVAEEEEPDYGGDITITEELLDESKEISCFKVLGNPIREILVLSILDNCLQSHSFELSISDANGKVVHTQRHNKLLSNKIELGISTLSQGVYYVSLVTEDKFVETRKFIVIK